MQLRIEDEAFANECPGNRCATHSMKAIDQGAETQVMGPKLDLNLKSQLVSLKKLKKYLYEDKKFGAASEFNCAGSVCRAISRNTGAIIPIPINFPLLECNLFFLARLIPGSRIEKNCNL